MASDDQHGSQDLARVEFGSAPETAELDQWIEGESPATRRLRAAMVSAARDSASVVAINGEPGTGKLRIAQWIHRNCRRGSRPLVTIECGTAPAPADLARVRDGLEASGDGGPGNVIIRNLQLASAAEAEGMLGILAAQGVSLRCGLLITFSGDLGRIRAQSLPFDRLLGRAGSAGLSVPPLRDRADDVPLLARHYVAEASTRYGRDIRGVSPQAMARLQRHDFPGNLRELALMLELATLRTTGDWITADAFPDLGAARADAGDSAEIVIRLPGSSLREIELQALRLSLRLTGGRVVRAAELLGITRHALRRKLEKYGLSELRYRTSPPSSADDEDDNYI